MIPSILISIPSMSPVTTKCRLRREILTALLCLGLSMFASDRLVADDYEVGPGDVLHIAVFGQQDMTGDFTVDAQGMLSFPFLGHVKASGMSTQELERKLTTLLSDGFLKKPHVSAEMKEFHSRRVYVTGEVQKPGAYGLRPAQSLFALISDIADLTQNAGHEVVVIRPPAAAPDAGAVPPSPGDSPSPGADSGPLYPGQVPGSQIFHVSIRDVRSGNPANDLRLEAGDTVYFPKAAQFYVAGYVNRPGAFRFDEGTTVYQALALAGGVADRGSAGGIKIVRIEGGKRKELKVKPTDLVLPEDTIVVPERFF
jgi:polysaccharide export outer membrane protein